MAKGNKVTKGNKKVTTQMLVNIEDMKNVTLLPFERMKMSFLLIIDFGLLIRDFWETCILKGNKVTR